MPPLASSLPWFSFPFLVFLEGVLSHLREHAARCLTAKPVSEESRPEVAHGKGQPACGRIPGLRPWEPRVSPLPLSDVKSGQQAGEFATQRRTWLLAQALNVCRNMTDAEDLVQEASLRFIQSFEKVESLPDERVCEGWLVTTITNLFTDQCRKRKIQESGAKELSFKREAAEAQEPASPSAYDTVTDEKFAQALSSLSPKIRATFEMHAAGVKYQDISREQGIPIGTVAKRLHDARVKLREFLKSDTTAEMH
jgi:RNA polymerase sigma-70 factor (ECF subfamily)